MKPSLLAALLAAGHASAMAAPLPLWELGMGAAVASFPDYRGADQQRAYLLPLPYVVYRGELLQVDRGRIRGLLFHGERVELDVSLNGSVPVRDGNPAREGMPDLDPTVEIGPSLNVMLTQQPERYRLSFRLPVRAVIASDFHHAHDAGLLAQPQLTLDLHARRGWKTSFSAGALFGDRRYHDYYYGVDPQYARLDRPAYRAAGGFSGTQLLATASKRYDRFWIGGFLRYDHVGNAAFEDSPLVKRRQNVAAGIGVSWVFAQAGQRVDADD